MSPWIACPRGVSAEQLADELGLDGGRTIREIEAAESAGVIERAAGGVRLTDHGWSVAAAGT
jgi:hypothetical protein